MTHKHTEKTCKHLLAVCADCGDVYCSKCNREWFKERYYSYPLTYSITSGYSGIVDVNTTNITDGDAGQPTHTHIQ